jgi:hypothetical protein
MQVALAAVGLIVGLVIGLATGWFLWHQPPEPEERSDRRPVRPVRSRSTAYEPSTPPAHRPTPRSRPVTALPRPIVTEHAPGPARSMPTFTSAPAGAEPSLAATATEPEPFAEREPAGVDAVTAKPEPEYRPLPAAPRTSGPAAGDRPSAATEATAAPQGGRPISIDDPRQTADRRRLQELLEANRRLDADAERLRREPSPSGDQLRLGDVPPPVRRPVSDPDDLVARHRKLDEDSRRMTRRSHG